MILGGARYAVPVIEEAHKLGLYVITCDYLPDNIAHRYSDEYCNVSIIEKEAVLEAARRLEIDGIMSFACDPGVTTGAYVAEQMGLPSCGPYESVRILQDKGLFRRFLTEHGFEVPMAKSYHTPEEALQDVELFHWPVIVKPVDSAGSKGVTRVDTPQQLEEGIRYACSFSHSHQFLIEDFLEKKGYSSDSDSFSVDGELKFVSFSSQRFDEGAENPYTPSAYSWPASLSQAHQQELHHEIQRLLDLLHMKTSIYNIETRETLDGKAYIMELSPRGGGNRLAEMLHRATGINLIENAVRAAVGMPLTQMAQRPYNGCWAEIILHSDCPGVFDRLEISERIRENVVEEDLWIDSGTQVGGFAGANEAIGTLVLKFESSDLLEQVLNHVKDYVQVILK